jgi:hypothetical protein
VRYDFILTSKKFWMKVVRFCLIAVITLLFASCRPNGSALDHDVMKGTPSNADTVLPHKYHLKSDSVKVAAQEEDVPNRLKR